MKYSDYFMECLVSLGFSHCFFVAGGNSMHLLESASSRFECIPVTHELSAAIASEYFNQVNSQGNKAFALVTAGPGFTNLVTGIAGAWLDSRELLIIGGQAKSSNLARGTTRQLGHQEIDGVSISKPITKYSACIDSIWHQDEINKAVSLSWTNRPGPVFLEVCLDISAKEIEVNEPIRNHITHELKDSIYDSDQLDLLSTKLRASKRPLILLGGGVKWKDAQTFLEKVEKFKIPVACTWTGADRVGENYKYFAGRPNTYGMRWANIFQQQSDFLMVIGSSLGFQQTGFNTENFLPEGDLLQVDIDSFELSKETPKNRTSIRMESGEFLRRFIGILSDNLNDISEWTEFLSLIRSSIPVLEDCQIAEAPFISPHEVISKVSKFLDEDDCVITASSGGTFTAAMQIFSTRGRQRFLGNKGLASMGYGLAGAIGASIGRRRSRIILFEGDGGFIQNAQELGTVVAQRLNLKIFVTCNDGYASIKTSQSNYFGGHYLGCDKKTGLFLPNWQQFVDSYGISYMEVNQKSIQTSDFLDALSSKEPYFFAIQSDPEQIYLPKLMSSTDASGLFQTAALHDMFPPLPESIEKSVFRYIQPPNSV